MAQRTVSAFKSTKNSRFADNTTGLISEADSRDMYEDVADSFLNISDHLLDEDDMASDSATKVPSQQSVKAYVDGNAGSPDTDLRFFEQDDFIHQSITPLQAHWGAANPAVGVSNVGINSTENAFGVAQISTSTSSSGIGALYKANNNAAYLFAIGNTYKLRFRVTLMDLSDGTETFTAWAGFHDLPTGSGNGTDGAFFRYTHSVNSGKWQAVTIVGGVETAEDTGVAPTAGVYQILEVRVNAVGTQVDFYINGTKTNDITTTIPTATDPTNIAMKIEKSAGSTARFLAIDWYDFLLTRTTAR